MKVIAPKALIDSMLVSASIAEPDTSETAWNALTAYTAGDLAIRTQTHRVYERLVAGTTATAPESDPTNWLDVGPTNRWAMFDNQISTASAASNTLSVTINTGYISGVAFVGLVGVQLVVTVKDAPGGSTVYTRTINLDGTIIADWYGYFFEPSVQLDTVALTDLPPYNNMQIAATITATGSVQCGGMVFGLVYDLGESAFGATAGITDYSVKEVDQFGTVTFVPRTFAKRATFPLMLEAAQMRRVQRQLSELRAKPAMWIGADDTTLYAPLVIYGWYRDFQIEVAYPTEVLVSLEIEGLT